MAALQLSEKQRQAGWQVVKFGEIAKNISERVEPSETDLEVYVGLEHLDPQSLCIQRRGVPSDVKGQKLRVRPGQIIFGKRRAYQKKLAVADFDGICSAHAMVLDAIPGKIIPELLPFLMQSDMFMDRAVAISEGSLSPTIKWKTLAIQEFPLPPKERQKEILEVLEKVEANNIKSALICNSSASLIKTIIKHLCSKESVPKLSLGDVTEQSAFGPRYPSNLYSLNGNVGTIRTTDFSNDSRINYSTIPYANLNEKKFSNHLLKDRDLLITRSGTIGQVDVFKEQEKPIIPGAFQIRFRLTEKVIPDYIRWVLLHPSYQRKMQTLSNGGVQKNITSKSLLKILLPVPEINEQRRVLDAIECSQNLSILASSKVAMLNHLKSKIFSEHLSGDII